MIRLDVSSSTEAQPYAVPPDNPFVGVVGAAPEVFAYGFRNPWRMDFDRATGTLFLADVGEDRTEEVNVVTQGGNYGWDRVEGSSCFSIALNCARPGDVAPIFAYSHAGARCSVTGGVVYRGQAVPSLYGAYVFADWCSGDIWAMDADRPGSAHLIAEGVAGIVTFGLGPDGEVLIARYGAPLLVIVEAERGG